MWTHQVGRCLNLLYNKHLFQKTGDRAQMKWRRYERQWFGQTHVMAVGARHTVLKLHDASRSVAGGMGFDKLSFFSPPNFKVFQKVLQQRSGVGFEYCRNVSNPPDEAG